VEKPKQEAIRLENENGCKYLRASTDPLALIGYQTLAAELSKIECLEAIFIPTSSGTTAEGLYQGFKSLNLNPQIHIVQTDNCCPIVSRLYEKENKTAPKTCETPSIAGAIVDIVGHRKESVSEAVIKSGGNGWVVCNEEIKKAIDLAKLAGADISANSALSIAGLKQAIAAGYSWKGPVVCLITGN
jgi:threonine synthase